MATHSSVLAWEIPRAGEPGGLQAICQTVLVTEQQNEETCKQLHS